MMKRLLPILALAFAAPLVAAPRPWTSVAAPAAQGSYVIGNPAAKVKLVEYASYTCPHCGHFARDSAPVLKGKMIASGSLSLEIRSSIHDRYDLVAAMLARCSGAAVFPKLHEALFARQEQWLQRAVDYDAANNERLGLYSAAAQYRAMAEGAGLDASAIDTMLAYVGTASESAVFLGLRALVNGNSQGLAGVAELEEIETLIKSAGYGPDRIKIDPSVVRGLEYYTGPVFEAELLFETVNEKGEPARFGSIGGGGRYDGLVGRFRSESVPGTGFSIGVSRLMAALTALGKISAAPEPGPVVVTVFDRDRMGDYQRMVKALRDAGIRAELYLGGSGPKAQLKYADKRNSPCVVIQGGDEKAKGVVQIKDLALGKQLSAGIADNATWREERPAQVEVPESDLVAAVRRILEGDAR